MAGTILKLGYTNPLTDAFGAHPVLGAVVDLNDGLTFTLASPDGLEIPSPPRTLVLAGNIRSQGENATRSITRHNREVTARLFLGPASSSAALLASLRTLLMWLASPPQIPITLQYQPFNGTAPMYLDVVGAAHNLPSDEGQWLRGQFEVLTVTFTCRPGMRGDRVVLSNLAPNPGFEQPGSRAVPVFQDTFANANQYASKVGSAPTVGAVNANYPDVVMVDAPLRYYRLNETSGTVAADISGFGQNATLVSGPTLGVTSPIFGDANDKAMTFNGSTQRATVPIGSGSSALPTGNGVWSIECWFKISANPAANVVLVGFGTYGTTKAAPGIGMNSSGGIFGTTFSGDTAATAAVTLNVWHHAVASWDGSTLRLYLDGALGPTATPGALSIGTHGAGFGASESGAAFFPGSLDEVAFYGTTLSSAHILAHFNAGNAGTGMGTTSNVLTVPSSARVAFGSPVWGSLNLWQIRFRYTSGGTFRFYLHFADGSNFLRVSIGSTMVITHVIAGVNTALAITSTLQLAPNAWYWLQVTQFPAMPNEVANVQATLLSDGNPVGGGPGTPGAQVAMLGPVPTQDALTALCGQPQLEASGAALLVGGPYSNVHTVALFGPGGWLLASSSGGTAGSGAWENSVSGGVNGIGTAPAASTYPGGPVSSFGAARIDAPPSGAFDLVWHQYSGGVPGWGAPGTWGIPAAAGQTLGGSVWVKSSGLAGSGTLALVIAECDASGAFLRVGTLASVVGNQAGWVPLAGTYVTGANCAWVDIRCRAVDATSASANAICWFDNAQLWNQTTTGMLSMPWCDLRSFGSPAQLVVSGLLGDLPAPAQLAVGAYLASFAPASFLSLYVGRKGITSPNAYLVGPSFAAFAAAFSPAATAVLDTSAFAGFTNAASVPSGGWNPRFTSPTAADAPGVYHVLTRFKTAQSPGNLANISVRVSLTQQIDAWLNNIIGSDVVGQWNGPFLSPSPALAQNVWGIEDAGQIILPPFPIGALTDPSVLFLVPRAQWTDSSGASAAANIDWSALLPVDGSLLVATLNNPSNGANTYVTSWLWLYSDGLLLNRGGSTDGPAWLWSQEAGPSANPAKGAGGAGTQNTGAVNVNSGADPALLLDPTQNGANGVDGVNQLVAVISDQAGEVLPLFAEVVYSPLYLEPR